MMRIVHACSVPTECMHPPLSSPPLMLFLFSKVENSQKGGRKREMPPGGGSSGGASEVIMPRGYWGEPTATIDWCEKNYEVSSQ